ILINLINMLFPIIYKCYVITSFFYRNTNSSTHCACTCYGYFVHKIHSLAIFRFYNQYNNIIVLYHFRPFSELLCNSLIISIIQLVIILWFLVLFENPIEIQKISQSKIITIIDMTRKSRYPAYFSGNIAIYLYMIWICRCQYDLLFLFILFIYK